MRKAVVDPATGFVDSVIECEDDHELEGFDLIPVPHDQPVANGWRYEDGAFEPPEAQPMPVPEKVWDWQFAGQAADERIISQSEALAWVGSGVVPGTLETAVKKAIPEPDRQFKVMLFLSGATEYPRHHELTPMLGPLLGKNDDAALDAFWIAAGQR